MKLTDTYPQTITAKDLPGLIGGQCSHGLPADAQLRLERVSITQVIAMWSNEDDSNPEYYTAMDAEDWADEDEPGYEDLERALRRGDQVPPLVLDRLESGSLRWRDGAHRISIALSVGITGLDAYIHIR